MWFQQKSSCIKWVSLIFYFQLWNSFLIDMFKEQFCFQQPGYLNMYSFFRPSGIENDYKLLQYPHICFFSY